MRGSGRQSWLLPVVLVVVVLTGVAGLAARVLYPSDSTTTPPISAVVPTEAPVDPADQPGPADVEGTGDAVGHPLYDQVRTLLQTHFDAINATDYRAWTGTVTAERVRGTPEESFRQDFDSVQDGTIIIYRIETSPDATARVMLTFTSTQDLADAPAELQSPCIHWAVVYPLTRVDGQWLIDQKSTSATPQHEAC
ncbi:hypothetical protein [Actinokineospora pegani]|uniref:hypothetical protein n=1 Tax=Actinokineospora pegani TaxID=2654637 RepID=UPI0012EA4DD7|nr:hypothetical protein [Actinokineospora pegani]